jgi:hypothetical protein
MQAKHQRAATARLFFALHSLVILSGPSRLFAPLFALSS